MRRLPIDRRIQALVQLWHDRLFRASFAGTALSGGGRARKKPEKHRGPCGGSGACDRLRARGITGIRRPRLVVIGLSLDFV